MHAVANSHGAISGIPGLLSCFEELFRTRIRLHENNENMVVDADTAVAVATDRMGLASLLTDQGLYADAVRELKQIVANVDEQPTGTTPRTCLSAGLYDKAASTLFRTQAAICDWECYQDASDALVASVDLALATNTTPAIHPFEALMWPCLTLETTVGISKLYAKRALDSAGLASSTGSTTTQPSSPLLSLSDGINDTTIINLGYISPDFTGKHPLAFLLQDMFRFHNKTRFRVHVYSLLEEPDGSPEVNKIRDAADCWTVLSSSMSSRTMAATIRSDGIDILVDLCGYTGTSLAAEVLALRPAPIQVAYMGFPSSSGAPFMDYMICDALVVPRSFRRHYSESLIVMPHSYFVNSHKFLHSKSDGRVTRHDYGLPSQGFVFCCHSRPDKIDPITFSAWLRAVKAVRKEGARNGNPRQAEACLWLLRSGPEMEANVRAAVAGGALDLGESDNACESCDYDDDDIVRSLVFADRTSRGEHLERLGLADVFLDTPSYGAHTVGCDCLSAGVPLLTLLRQDDGCERKRQTPPDRTVGWGRESILTEKLSSRVGASLVKALGGAGLEKDLIVSSMLEYEACMVRAAQDEEWYCSVRQRVQEARATAPLFDTDRWVRNMERGFLEAWSRTMEGEKDDIYVVES